MTLQVPVFTQDQIYPAWLTRRALSINSTAGVKSPGSDFNVTPGSGIQVSVASGEAVISQSLESQEGSVTDSGPYYAYNDGAITPSNSVLAPANYSRIDRVVLQVIDVFEQASTGSSKVQCVWVQGTETSGTSLASLAGAPALPSNSLNLAYVLHTVGESSILASNILMTTTSITPSAVSSVVSSNTNLGPGVVRSTDYQVAQHAGQTNMTLDVAAGNAWLPGSGSALYSTSSIATQNVSFQTADSSNPRIDQVFLLPGNQLLVVAGTPTAGATVNNRSGAVSDATIAAAYPTRIRLADVLVPAAITSLVNGNIMDRRPRARGKWRQSNAGDQGYYNFTGGWAAHPVGMRVECSGNAARLIFSGVAGYGGGQPNGSATVSFAFSEDGVSTLIAPTSLYTMGPNVSSGLYVETLQTFTAGSHMFQIASQDNGGANNPTFAFGQLFYEDLFDTAVSVNNELV
jgi:hypothetical protein